MTTQLTSQKWLNLFETTYTNKLGKVCKWIFASRRKEPVVVGDRKADAVIIVPIYKDTTAHVSKVVLIKQYRPAIGGDECEFPAGLIDGDESYHATARRELKEETGLEMDDVRKYIPPCYSSSGMTDESVAMVFATCYGTPYTDGNEESEDIEIITLERHEIGEFLDVPGRLFSIKTYLGLLLMISDDSLWWSF